MMNMRLRKSISILALISLCGQFLISASPSPITQTEDVAQTDIYPASSSDIMGLTEDISLRTDNTKHFHYSENAYIAALYTEPVHFQNEEGQWEEINNTLSTVDIPASQLSTAAAQSHLTADAAIPYLENTTNSFKVRVPEALSAEKPLFVSYQGYTLSFFMQDAQETAAQMVPMETQVQAQKQSLLANALQAAENGDLELSDRYLKEAAVAVPNQKAAVTYESVLPSTDVKYEISGQKLKESLVFNQPPAQQSFSFVLHYTGLTPVVQEFGAVHFYPDNTENPENQEPVFVINAPYMFDSGDALSMDVSVSITPTDTGCIYRLTPDYDWLHDEERVYPVTIDPTVTTSTNAADIQDNGVNQSNPTTNYMTVDRMYVGSNMAGTAAMESRIYIRFPRVAAIPLQAYIHEAIMYLDHYPTASYQTASMNTLDVYEVGSSDHWLSNTITWNTQFSYKFTNRVYSRPTDKSYSTETFNITSLVKKWYSTTSSNNGLVIKPRTLDTSKTNRTCFCSSDIGSANAAMRPRIVIEYYTGSATPGITHEKVYNIQNVGSSKYMDVRNNGGSGTAVIQYRDMGGGPNQQWLVKHFRNGIYFLTPLHNTGLQMYMINDTLGQDAFVGYENTASKSQMFQILANGDGTFRILSLHSNSRALDIEGRSSADNLPVELQSWTGNNYQKWRFTPVYFGEGGTYRDVKTQTPNCFGYALMDNSAKGPGLSGLDPSNNTAALADKFKKEILKYASSCRQISSYYAPIEQGEYRIALRAPNDRDDGIYFHVIYQLSNGRWAGKNDTSPSQLFGWENPSVTREMWVNNLYTQSAGTIYFAVRKK